MKLNSICQPNQVKLCWVPGHSNRELAKKGSGANGSTKKILEEGLFVSIGVLKKKVDLSTGANQ